MQDARITKLQIRLRRLFFYIGIPLGTACLAFIGLYIFTPPSPPEPVVFEKVKSVNPTVVPKAVAKIPGVPVRFVISSLSIDTSINAVGLTSQGAMDIPENPDEVAWYQYGAIPGQAGDAVIAGHYGWKDGHGSIFNNLNTLKAGDIISVYDATGIESSFSVRETRLYDPTADAAEVFTSNDSTAHLNLITCQGTWVSSKDSYSNRLVVFTDSVPNQ